MGVEIPPYTGTIGVMATTKRGALPQVRRDTRTAAGRRGEKRRDEGKRGRGVTAPHVCAEVELCSCRCVQKRDEPFLTTSSSPHSSPLHPPSSHMFRPPFLLLPLRLPALLSSSVLSSTLSAPAPVRGGANSRSSAVPYSTSTPMSALRWRPLGTL